MNETESILSRIDAALKRMEADGAKEDGCIYYAHLEAKRDAIASGQPYATYNVAPYLIRAVGAQIPNCNLSMSGGTIKARGNWEDIVIPKEATA